MAVTFFGPFDSHPVILKTSGDVDETQGMLCRRATPCSRCLISKKSALSQMPDVFQANV